MSLLSLPSGKGFGVYVSILVVAAVAWRWVARPGEVAPARRAEVQTVRPKLKAAEWLRPTTNDKGAVRVLPAVGQDAVVVEPELAKLAEKLNVQGQTVREDLEVLEALLGGFRQLNRGEMPFGAENDEITAQLIGRNASKVAVLRPAHPAVNEKGQLMDRWGTPYFFHPISGVVWELRSAGPDKLLFTPDDVVL